LENDDDMAWTLGNDLMGTITGIGIWDHDGTLAPLPDFRVS
jgi:hypothetical protein